MELFAQSVVLGLITGLVYSLTGAGLVSVYRTSRIINFAQGSIGTLGLYAAYPLTERGAPYWLVAIVAIGAAALAGLCVGWIVNLLASRRDELMGGLAAIALSLVIDSVLTLTMGGSARAFPSMGTHTLFRVASVNFTASDVGIAAAAIIAFGALGLLFSRTTTGLGMRAISENATAARIVGLRSGALRMGSWVICGILAGVGALFLAPMYSLTPTSIEGELVYGFAAVVIGGFDSIIGALVAGIGLGIVSNLIGVYVNLDLITTGLFAVMIPVLLLRPYGLFGRRPLERV
ncbi:branched-chain amino acid ABC transporter permease [Nocardioides terrisoli]|uniref:branched-chain amino acid ABC transporter permease n=1 Tax=Nocardioides terrisoli TaxID=3388267 RepID=UPI00287BBD2B|nr:branched-chain amino acid ABC transporter permease [Nocardioides marmorisolisilvae]